MMTLAEAIEKLEADDRLHPTAKSHEILLTLRDLAENYGADATGPWRLMRTSFHGGGEISRHTSPIAAAMAAHSQRTTGCTCGCCGIVAETDKLLSVRQNEDEGPNNPYLLCE